MNSNAALHTFASRQTLHLALSQTICDTLKSGIETNGNASLAVSGGSTPKPLFEALSHCQLEWEKVLITLVDERWVDPESEASNEHLVRSILMQNRAKNAQFIALKSTHNTAAEAENSCAQRLKGFNNDFDVVVLGMGTDAHTASFFPEAERLSEALESQSDCIAITPPEAPYERMTLTLSRLLRSRRLFLHIEGETKYTVYKEALEEGALEEMPIRAFIHRHTKPSLEVYYAA